MSFWIDIWNYYIADIPTVLDKRIVLISKACFGPAEIDELGIDSKISFAQHSFSNHSMNIHE